MNNNIKTLKFVCKDNFGDYVYRCIETDILYKDVAPDNEKPEILTCGNEIDGDPGWPIDQNIELKFIDRTIPNRANEFNYMMLGRLKSDCEYFLGNGNRYVGHLWANTVEEHITEMKKIYNEFTEEQKPQWITYKDILNYEKEMLKTV
jgi:hypothetical protein